MTKIAKAIITEFFDLDNEQCCSGAASCDQFTCRALITVKAKHIEPVHGRRSIIWVSHLVIFLRSYYSKFIFCLAALHLDYSPQARAIPKKTFNKTLETSYIVPHPVHKYLLNADIGWRVQNT